MIVDAHNDLLLLVDRRPPVEQAEYFRERWLPQLRAGDVAVQVLPAFAADLRSVSRLIGAADRVAGLPLVLDSLAARGVSTSDIQKIARDNWLRVFGAELGRPSAASSL